MGASAKTAAEKLCVLLADCTRNWQVTNPWEETDDFPFRSHATRRQFTEACEWPTGSDGKDDARRCLSSIVRFCVEGRIRVPADFEQMAQELGTEDLLGDVSCALAFHFRDFVYEEIAVARRSLSLMIYIWNLAVEHGDRSSEVATAVHYLRGEHRFRASGEIREAFCDFLKTVPQNSGMWYFMRTFFTGASSISKFCGQGYETAAAALRALISGAPARSFPRVNMYIGHAMEDRALDLAAGLTGFHWASIGMCVNPRDPSIAASLDAVATRRTEPWLPGLIEANLPPHWRDISADDMVIEAKNPVGALYPAESPPIYYLGQIMAQMFASGRKHGMLVAYKYHPVHRESHVRVWYIQWSADYWGAFAKNRTAWERAVEVGEQYAPETRRGITTAKCLEMLQAEGFVSETRGETYRCASIDNGYWAEKRKTLGVAMIAEAKPEIEGGDSNIDPMLALAFSKIRSSGQKRKKSLADLL